MDALSIIPNANALVARKEQLDLAGEFRCRITDCSLWGMVYKANHLGLLLPDKRRTSAQ